MMIRFAFECLGAVEGRDYNFLVEGDDNAIFFNDSDLFERASVIIRDLGFTQETDYYVEPTDLEFIGIRIFKRTDGKSQTYKCP